MRGGVKTNEGKKKARRLPTFPPREAVSSALESLTSVFGMGTGISSPLWPPDNVSKSSFCPPACGSRRRGRTLFYAKGLSRKAGRFRRNQQYGQASRLISTARLNTSPHLHLQPINQIVSLESSGELYSQGSLVLRWASRLDAFSGYPFRT